MHVVGIGEQSTGRGVQAESAEIVPGDEFAHHRAGVLLGSAAAYDDRPKGKSGLHGGEFFELRGILS